MSFFNDFLDELNIDNMKEKTFISLVLGYGIGIIGNIKILNLSDEEIEFKTNKGKIKIIGKDLIVKTISKGEVLICGNVMKVESC